MRILNSSLKKIVAAVRVLRLPLSKRSLKKCQHEVLASAVVETLQSQQCAMLRIDHRSDLESETFCFSLILGMPKRAHI